MKICGKAGAIGMAQLGMRQGCPLSPRLIGIFLMTSPARSSQVARQQVLDGDASQACSMLHCSQPQHKGLSSS